MKQATLMLCAIAGVASWGRAAELAHTTFQPEPIRIAISDLPKPFATQSADNHPRVVPPPEGASLALPAGFRVSVFAEVPSARWLALTPSGDVLCAASRENKVVLLKTAADPTRAGGEQLFLDEAQGANLPFGMAFAGGYFYLGNTDAVLRYPYQKGEDSSGETFQLGDPEQITSLPGQGYNQHWTRNVVVSPDGQKLYVSVGSKTNASVEPLPRASVLRMNLDGSQRKVFASGLRNPVGLDFHPQTKALYATVNERDGLGDNLVPDYLARLQEGEFYGWPYAYLTPERLDPRLNVAEAPRRRELAAKTETPEVLFQSHSAALGLAFYDGDAFPEHYRDGAFVAFRGSWNRDRGTGYKIVFVPFERNGRPRGYYEDFVKGFLEKPSVPTTWGRPVGVLAMPDGSLLFTEEANGRVYRVSFDQSG
ncbi:MAG: sorbosone dehydrogenase family protein [Planctomycetota bacterium]|nr:MAG: sorbosone dehydrogenase family protein [Planctomycetota bacterium]